jgi:hypothetical protein
MLAALVRRGERIPRKEGRRIGYLGGRGGGGGPTDGVAGGRRLLRYALVSRSLSWPGGSLRGTVGHISGDGMW